MDRTDRNTAGLCQQRADRRSGNRHKLVLRVGLIEQDGKWSFALIKNISSSGVHVKLHGDVVQGKSLTLRVGDEDPVTGALVWVRDGLAGLHFDEALNPQALLRIAQKMTGHKRRTAPRVTTEVEVFLRTAGTTHRATLCDLSMVGARLRTYEQVAFGETTMIEVPSWPSLVAFIRWTNGLEVGVSFQTVLPMQIVSEVLAKRKSCE